MTVLNLIVSLQKFSFFYDINNMINFDTFKPPPKEISLYNSHPKQSDIWYNLILCKCWLLKLVIIVLLSYRTMTVNPRYVELWFLQCRLSDLFVCVHVCACVCVCVNIWNKKEKQHTFFLTQLTVNMYCLTDDQSNL